METVRFVRENESGNENGNETAEIDSSQLSGKKTETAIERVRLSEPRGFFPRRVAQRERARWASVRRADLSYRQPTRLHGWTGGSRGLNGSFDRTWSGGGDDGWSDPSTPAFARAGSNAILS